MYYKPIKQLKTVALLNIITQISCSFLGLYNVAVAETVQPGTQKNSTIPSLITKIYTVEFGENTESILKKYNISLDLFYQLNPSYDATQGIPTLRVGDRINLPLNPFEREIATALRTEKQENKVEETIAKAVATTGGILSSDNAKGKEVSDQLQSMATNMLSNQASNALQQWLGQYGHARVQLGVDKDFSLKSSKYDFLAPLVDRENSLFFLQNSIHRTDDRTQTNVGLGLRHFADDYMLGGNTFWDYDISRGHSRAGLGLEYWRDFLKLGANGYFRLSDWKDSKDLDDYEERAANGWDLRVEGYIPQYPKLGGKLTYEQYYGDEVALFGKDHRQQNPYAITAEINYTPVPFITVGAAQRQGKSGKNDTHFNLQLNYHFGVPWAKQIDPNAVAVIRSLAGSRYDFVERNNNIILDYRKKEVLVISAEEIISGSEKEQKQFNITVVKSVHGGETFDYSAPDLEAAGGKVEEITKGQYSITLPEYKEGANNLYTITAIATDSRGNKSNTTTTQIMVKAAEFDASQSSFEANPKEIYADDKDKVTLTFNAKDKVGYPLLGQDVKFIVTDSQGNEAPSDQVKIDGYEKDKDGNYTAILKGTLPDTYTITPQVNGVVLNDLKDTVKLIAHTVDASKSSFEASPKNIAVGGDEKSTITFKANNIKGDPMLGLKEEGLSFEIMGSDGKAPVADHINLSEIEDHGDGTYSATLKGTLADTYTVIPQVSGQNVGDLKDSVELMAGNINAGQSEFNANPKSIQANGNDASTLTFTAKDAHGNELSDEKVTFVVKNSKDKIVTEGFTLSAVNPEGKGVYTVTLKGTLADTYTVIPQVSGQDVVGLQDTVELMVGEVDTDKSSFEASPKNIAANGQESSKLTLKIVDSNENPLLGETVGFKVVSATTGLDVSTDKVQIEGIQELGEGNYEATLKGTLADTYIIMPSVAGKALNTLTDRVTLTAGAVDAGQSEFNANPKSIQANGNDASTLTFTAKDAHGNELSDEKVTFVVKNSKDKIVTEGFTLSAVNPEGKGVYTVTLKGTLADTYTVIPQVSGQDVGSLKDTVELTAGAVDVGQSDFSANPRSITADGKETSTLSLELKDAKDNPLAGQTVSFKITYKDDAGTEVEITNDDVIITGIKDNKDGTYSAILKGTLAKKYTVTPIVENTALTALAKDIELIDRKLDETKSDFTVSKSSISADGKTESILTFTAHDDKDLPLSGLDIGFKLTSGDSSGVTIGDVKDNADGTYSAAVTGALVGAYTFSPMNGTTPISKTETINVIPLNISIENFNVNEHEFAADSGFPSMGFKGAHFTFSLPDNIGTRDFDWEVDQDWVTVSADGKITFTGDATSKTVKITGKNGSSVVEHTMNITHWFENNTSGTGLKFYDAQAWCSDKGKGELPTRDQFYKNSSRGVGALMSEWGLLTDYGWSGGMYWSSELFGGTGNDMMYYTQNLGIFTQQGIDGVTNNNLVVCVKSL